MGGLQNESEEVGVAEVREGRHDVHFTVPAPAGIGVDLQELDDAVGVGAEVDLDSYPRIGGSPSSSLLKSTFRTGRTV